MLELARISAEVTHNHPEGIKGSQAIAECVFMARNGATKDEIKKMVQDKYYSLANTMDYYHENRQRGASCQVTVPVAIQAFLESTDFEDTIRNAISVGGDSDTIAAMAGSIAWSYYKTQNNGLTPKMKEIKEEVQDYMPEFFIEVADLYEAKFG